MALSKTKKIILIISSTIIGLLIVLLFSLNSILSNKAESFLREKINETDTSMYHIDFRDVKVNLFGLAVKVYDIEIKPTTKALYNAKQNELGPLAAEASISRIRIGGIALLKSISGKAYELGTLSIDEPKIKIYSPRSIFYKPEYKSPETDTPISDSTTGSMPEYISLNTFDIENASFTWVDMSRDKEEIHTSGLAIELDGIKLDPSSDINIESMLDLESIEIKMDSIFMELPGNMYSLNCGTINISSKSKNLILNSFTLTPAYEKGKFGQVFGKQTDRFDIKLKQLKIKELNFDSIVNKKVIIGSIDIIEPHADIFRDKRVDRDMSIFPKLFQESAANIPVPLEVKVVNVKNAYLQYGEMIEDTDRAGSVYFENLNVTISGLNNNPQLIKNGQSLEVKVNGNLMGKAAIEVFFDLPMGRKDNFFTFHGSTSSFKVPLMNPLVAPLALIELTKGQVESVNFYGLARQDTAVGRVKFLYKDVQLNVIKKQAANKGKVHESRFLSFVAKSVMHKNNPLKDKPPRIGRMHFARDPNKGFFNYIWKTMQNGLINTMVPSKRLHAYDMDWPTFEAKWEEVLEADRKAVSEKSKGKKSRKD